MTILHLPPLELQLGACVAENQGLQTWQAHCRSRHADVVVKLSPDAALDPDQERLLWHEASALASLRSPRFAPLLAFGRTAQGLALATEKLPGRSLESELESSPLAPSKALAIAHGLTGALEELHALGYVHGDLKPAHILIQEQPDGEIGIALCDFGLSRRLLQTAPQSTGATFRYAAPEQLGLLREPVSPASDLYALGLILREMLGAPLSHGSLTLQELRDLPPPPELHGPLAELLRRLNRLHPDERYSTARGLLHDLDLLRRDRSTTLALGTLDARDTLVEPSLVGRQRELKEIEARLVPKAPPLFLSAHSGLGKTRLLEAVAERARSRGQTVFTTRAIAPREGTSFPLWEVLSLELGAWLKARPDLLSHACQRLEQRSAVLSQAFAGLRLLSPIPEPTPYPLDTVLESLLILLQALQEKEPLLFVFDDVQSADTFTCRFLGQASLPVPVVAAFRSSEVDANHLLHSAVGQAMLLSPLRPKESLRLLRSMAGPLPSEATDELVAQGKGEPFHLQSLLRGAVEAGALRREEERWVWTRPSRLSSDSKTAWVLSDRLYQLPPQERQLLEVGAVLGSEFNLSTALGLIAEEGPDRPLLEATQRGLLRVSDDRAVFSHDKVREALLSELPAERLRRLHAQAADWFASHQPEAHRTIALHWFMAGDGARAYHPAVLAARSAQSRIDYAEAANFLRIALEVCQEPSERPQLLRELALSLSLSDQYDLAPAVYREALAVHDAPMDRAELLAGLCEQLGRLNDSEQSVVAAIEGLQLLGVSLPQGRLQVATETLKLLSVLLARYLTGNSSPPGPEQLRRVQLCEGLTEPLARLERLETLLWCLARGAVDLGQLQTSAQGSRLISQAAQICGGVGLRDWARTLSRHAMEGAKLHPRKRGYVMGQSALTLLMTGDPNASLALFQEALSVGRAYRDGWNTEVCTHHVALCHYFLGDFRAAEELADELLPGPYQGDVSNPLASAKVLALLGKGQEWKPVVEEFGPRLLDTGFSWLAPTCLGLWALKEGNFGEAVDQLRTAVKAHIPLLGPHSAGASAWLATTWRVLVEQLPQEAAALKAKIWREVEDAVRTSRKQTAKYLVSRPHYLREAAICSARAGRFYLARTQFEESFAISEQLGMKFESAWTQYERGRFAAVAGWTDWRGDQAEGLSRAHRLGGWLPGVQLAQPLERQVSKIDRFDRVLDAGRRLVALEGEVLETLRAETAALLRCDRVHLVPTEASDLPDGWSETLFARCQREGRAVTEAQVEEPSRSMMLHEARSTLMAPLYVEGDRVGVLVAWQKSIGGFFGEEEARLADYLCALAGAGLENDRVLAERDQVFASLQTSEQRFRGFFEYAGVGTALLDETGVVLQENPYLCSFLGCSMLGRNLLQITHATDRGQLKTALLGLQSGELSRFEAEVRLHRAGGEVAWTQSCMVKLPVREGEHSRYLLTVADTTHRRIAEMMTFLENERRGLAAEIHDELAQDLWAHQLMLAQIKEDSPAVEQARDFAKQMVDRAAALIAALRNPLAEGVDLCAALKSLVTKFSHTSMAQVEVDWPETPPAVSDLTAMVLYRVAQESLANIIKHAHASNVRVALREVGNAMELLLQDDGQGFDSQAWLTRAGVEKHFGLLSMRDRVEVAGGSFDLLSLPGQGTRLKVSFPLT